MATLTLGPSDLQLVLEETAELGHDALDADDPRPQWLRGLRDAHEPYYRFLYNLNKVLRPIRVVEVGTYVGTSAAHLAFENPGVVVTVDINPDAKRHADALGLPNLVCITSDSAEAIPQLAAFAPFDLAYIDGLHNFNTTYGEYLSYRKLVRVGGLLVFDDVGLQMATNEMEIFWEHVVEPKVRLDWLHHTGFGVAIRTDVEPPPWEAVIGAASERMRAYAVSSVSR